MQVRDGRRTESEDSTRLDSNLYSRANWLLLVVKVPMRRTGQDGQDSSKIARPKRKEMEDRMVRKSVGGFFFALAAAVGGGVAVILVAPHLRRR